MYGKNTNNYIINNKTFINRKTELILYSLFTMPVPKPKKGEKEQDFVGRCISQLKDEDPNRADDQVQAICFDAWRSAKKESEKMTDENSKVVEKKRDEDGNIIVAENVKVVFGATIGETVSMEDDDE